MSIYQLSSSSRCGLPAGVATKSRPCNRRQRSPRVKESGKRGGCGAPPQRAHPDREPGKKGWKKRKSNRDGEGRSCEQRKGNYCVIVGVWGVNCNAIPVKTRDQVLRPVNNSEQINNARLSLSLSPSLSPHSTPEPRVRPDCYLLSPNTVYLVIRPVLRWSFLLVTPLHL